MTCSPNIRQSISDWIFRATVPEAPPVTLVQRRIFILPTRQGYFFALHAAAPAARLDQLRALARASCSRSCSRAWAGVAMLHTWRNLAHLKLRPGRCDPVFAGETAHFGVTVETPSRTRFAVAMRRRDEEPCSPTSTAGDDRRASSLPAAATRRGRVRCGRLEIFTRYPVGLFHAWSYVDFGLHGASSIRAPIPPPARRPRSRAATTEEGIPVPGDEEFNMLRAYHAGDPPRQIAWKALAREQGLLTKEFNATASRELWLDWDEARGRRPRGAPVGALPLGDRGRAPRPELRPAPARAPRSRPARGEAHRTRCLEALALFEATRSPNESPRPARRLARARRAQRLVAARRDGLRGRAPPAAGARWVGHLLRGRRRVARVDRVVRAALPAALAHVGAHARARSIARVRRLRAHRRAARRA